MNKPTGRPKSYTETHKTCAGCKLEKPREEFYQMASGHPFPKCKDCVKAANAERKLRPGYQEEARAKRALRVATNPESYTKQLAASRRSYHNNKHKSMWYAAKQRAKRNGIEFNLDLEDVQVPSHCPILDIKLENGTKDCYFNSPSLDRIDNSKGYIKGNVMVVSMRANSMKNAASFEELLLFCDRIPKIIAKYDIVRPVEEVKPTELVDKEPLG